MKTLSLITILLITLTCHAQTKLVDYKCQWGIHGGVSASWFSGGDRNYRGINHNYESITAGLFHKSRHMQVELNYQEGGARNPREDNRTFKTYNIVLPITYIAHAGPVNFQAGMYVSKLIGASNSDFYTPQPNFGWRVSRWKWYQRFDIGPTVGIGFDLHPVYFEIHFKHGIRNVRQYDYDWRGNYDPSYQWCRNASLSAELYIPLNR